MKPKLNLTLGLLSACLLLLAACDQSVETVGEVPLEEPAAQFAVFLDENIVDGYTWPKSDGTQDWQLGDSEEISISIYDQENGTLLFSETRPSFLVDSEFPDYEYGSEVHFELNDLAGGILPGYFVVMKGAGVVKTHVVVKLSISTLNADADVILGTADPGRSVNVTTCTSESCTTILATTNDAGIWQADFAGKADLTPGIEGTAMIKEPGHPDDDGSDRTVIEWSIPEPYIRCWPEGDWLEGLGWPLDSEMTLIVKDDGATIHSLTGTVITPPWDPVATWVRFDLPFDLNAGDEVTLTDGLITKRHTITDLTVEEFADEAENTVTGTAEPGSRILFGIHEVAGFEFSILVDEAGDGSWIVDFDTDPPIPHDLVPGTGIAITQFDDDSDMTHIERFLP